MNTENQFWEDLKSGKFVSMVKESSKGRALTSSKEVFNILKPLFAAEGDVEKMYFIFMDQKNRIISIDNLFTGSVASSAVYPREIIKRIIELKANGAVMIHNHPSGDVSPSHEDKSITYRVMVAAASIDVQVHDHIIIGEGYYSMADEGVLRDIRGQVNNFLKGGLMAM
jgi:DNA repair protein RadC